MTELIVKPKRPASADWQRHDEYITPSVLEAGYPVECWTHPDGTGTYSAVEYAVDPGSPDIGPEYHLSISYRGGRIPSEGAQWVLAQFGLEDAKEDNHTPGGWVRHFWRPVADHLSGYECPCVDDEPAIREDRGDFVWRGLTR